MVERTTPTKAAEAQPVCPDLLSLKALLITWRESNRDPVVFAKKILQEDSKQ